ncbi:Tubulin-specific chaperone C [Hondaea fermentalgiana]|uniref:Tubulin-specific chaperone C n=1 Tax=Hondaea fermentalgiana TaxID=2315210 RepID=A0A2R5G785_9STRA|nr:Tubulin-specific chaperone C [Hondaea fermentalgiana]|eukprot:GBG26860.1 Tubulin-specific chaperone C [Hondaea fermentalgiana]
MRGDQGDAEGEALRQEHEVRKTQADVEEAERKRNALDERWRRKLEGRKEEQQRKLEEKQEALDPTQDIDAFVKRFDALHVCINDGLEKAKALAQGEKGISRLDLKQKLDGLVKTVGDMQKELAGATLYLPPYDIRQASDKIASATAKIENARVELAPRRKFAFGNKSKPRSSSSQNATTSQSQQQPQQQKQSQADVAPPTAPEPVRAAEALLAKFSEESTELVVENKKGETINIAEIHEVSSDQDVRLRSLEDCTVHLLKPTSAVRFLHLKRCRIFVGPVAGSCFFEACEDCVFMIASRQIRIHDSTRCDFYLHVLSRPIIEHCNALRFAPYGLSYKGLDSQVQAAGLAAPRAADMWKDVDDFRWLRQQQSPNWAILDEADREKAAL